MRRAANPAITAQMYRHFATMTVAVTALIAFFANGEKQTAVAAQPVAAQTAPAAKKPAPPPSDASEDAGSWGSDDGGDFGQPTTPTSSSAGSWFSSPFGANDSDRTLAGGPAVRGLDNDPDDPDGASDKANAPAPPSAADIAAATAASKLRSGAGSID